MKIHIYIIIFSIAPIGFSQELINISPSVVTGCGGSLQGWSMTSINTDFTLGEIAIETVFSDEFIMTQGFHQSDLNIIKLEESDQVYINVYPNPTIEHINIEITQNIYKKIEIFLLNTSGKIIYSKTINTDENLSTINMKNLSIGTYFLEVLTYESKDLFKIQKLK